MHLQNWCFFVAGWLYVHVTFSIITLLQSAMTLNTFVLIRVFSWMELLSHCSQLLKVIIEAQGKEF